MKDEPYDLNELPKDVTTPKTPAEKMAEIKAAQQGKSYDEIKSSIEGDIVAELDRLPSQQHNWVDRGAVLSCEYAGHPNHHAYKRK